MTNEAQKLRRFKDAVYTEAEGKVNKLISEAWKEKDAKLKETQNSVRSRISDEKLRIDKEQRQRLTREVSAARLESQRRILLHRGELSDKVFRNVKNVLRISETAAVTERGWKEPSRLQRSDIRNNPA